MLDLRQHPRARLVDGPTALQPLERLSRHLGGPRIFLKRDDLLGVGAGGNKLRKFEFLLGAARADGADTVILDGGVQSNAGRLLAAAAARLGLRCELVLKRRVPRSDAAYERNGNVLLDRLFGARLHFAPGDADASVVESVAARVRAEGGRPWVIPFGGSNWMGALGYAVCAAEIVEQASAMDTRLDCVVVAGGSGGTHAGLVAGLAALGSTTRTLAYTVLAPAEELARSVRALAGECLDRLVPGAELPGDAVRVAAGYIGPGYGIPTPEMVDAVARVARLEGVLLDPVYTGKAMAGLIDWIERGEIDRAESVAFVHTGGLPGLFAYESAFADL